MLTGNPRAPTPAAGDDDTSIATTSFVVNYFNGRVTISDDTPQNGQMQDGDIWFEY